MAPFPFRGEFWPRSLLTVRPDTSITDGEGFFRWRASVTHRRSVLRRLQKSIIETDLTYVYNSCCPLLWSLAADPAGARTHFAANDPGWLKKSFCRNFHLTAGKIFCADDARTGKKNWHRKFRQRFHSFHFVSSVEELASEEQSVRLKAYIRQVRTENAACYFEQMLFRSWSAELEHKDQTNLVLVLLEYPF